MIKYVSIYKIAQYGTFFVFSMLLGYIIYESLTDWYLWYDEAGQFYISKGLHHNSKPFASYLGVANVIYNNRYFNLDPGGFSVLLHYWSMGSNHYAYLRLLPLLFFLVSIFVAYKIGIQLFHTHFSAILLASVFLLNPIIVNLAGELRAYSMEMCGVLISLYYMKKISKNLSISKLVILALILDVFMTSRYGFVIDAFAISLCIIFMMYKQDRFSAKTILPIIAYSCITLMGVALVFFVSMIYQNATARPLSYVPYLGQDFQEIIVSDISLRYYIIWGYVVLCHFRRIPQDFYICMSLLISTLFVILSLFNRFPWDEHRTFSVTICQHLAIGIMMLRHLNGKKIFFAVLLFGLYGFYKYKIDGFSIRFSHREVGRVLSKEMEFCVKNKNNNEIIFCGWGFQPTIRYLFEEHNWNKKFAGVYPEKICFSNNISYNCVKVKEFNVRFYIFSDLEKISPGRFRLCEGHKYVYKKVFEKNEDK